MGNFRPPQAQCLVWIDIETTQLPTEHDEVIDFSGVHVLEFAMIVTDFDLDPLVGYSEVVKLTKAGADSLRANDVVLSMHKANGLIKDAAKATMTLADVEAETVKVLKTGTTFDKGEFMIAGSGVAAFDLPLIKAKMPKLASHFAYYPFDIGVERRMSRILAGKPIVNYAPKSYGDDKLHRALADVQAHLDEAKQYREWFRSVT